MPVSLYWFQHLFAKTHKSNEKPIITSSVLFQSTTMNPIILTLTLAMCTTLFEKGSPTFLGMPGLRDPVERTEPADIWRRRRPFRGDTESDFEEDKLRLCRDWYGSISSEDFLDEVEAEDALENWILDIVERGELLREFPRETEDPESSWTKQESILSRLRSSRP